MSRAALLLLVFLVLLLPAGPARAEKVILEIDPLADGDMNHFDRQGDWKLDKKMDDVYTVIVHPRGKEDSTLRYRMKSFPFGFRVSMSVMGGSRYKGLEAYVVPEKGDWIPVPLSKRYLAKTGWHSLALTVEKGQAWVKVDKNSFEKVPVPTDQKLTFALKLLKRNEAAFKKLKILYLMIQEGQKDPEEGFVRIFDGKTLDGWKMLPEGVINFKLQDQRIEAKVPTSQQRHGELRYGDAVFKDFVLRFRAARGAHNLILLGRGGSPDGKLRSTHTTIDGYFTGDQDWNEVEWSATGRQIVLRVNGRESWKATAQHESPLPIIFVVGRGGRAAIRDIRVKGQTVNRGATWERYVRESGGAVGVGGGEGRKPTEQPESHPGDDGGAFGDRRMPDTKVLFNGKDIEEWKARPSGVWSVEDGRLVGITLEKETQGEIFYSELVFTDYRLTFQMQTGTIGAMFLAWKAPKQGSGKKPVAIVLKPEWMGEGEWTEFEAIAWGHQLTLKAGGKKVGNFNIPEEEGYLGFVIDKNSAMGLKEIVYHRPKPQ